MLYGVVTCAGVDPSASAAVLASLSQASASVVGESGCTPSAVAAGVRALVAQHAGVRAVLVVGGDGLGAGQDAPDQVRLLCGGGRLLSGVAEAGYRAAGPHVEVARRGVAGVSPDASFVVACCPTEGAGAAAAAMAPLIAECVAALPSSPSPSSSTSLYGVVTCAGVDPSASAAVLASLSQASASVVGESGCTPSAVAAGVRALVAQHAGVRAVLVVGGDGLGAGQDAPDQVRLLCGGGRLLSGVAEAGYRAAGPHVEVARRGVAGVSPDASFVVACCPAEGAGAAAAAMVPLIAECVAALPAAASSSPSALLPKVAAAAAVAEAAAVPTVVGRARASQHTMLSMEEALRCVEEQAPAARPAVSVPLGDAVGLAAAADVRAPHPHPPFRAAIKDGYAVCAADGAGDRRVLAAAATAGADARALRVESGFACRVSTGGMVPEGADAVVQVEDTTLVSADRAADVEVVVRIDAAPRAGQDVRPVGSDVAAGAVLLRGGAEVTAAEVGLLASAGVATVECVRPVRVAVFSSGNEVRAAGGGALHAGEIYDSNRAMLLAALPAGCVGVDLGIVPDTPEAIEDAIRRGLRSADMVVSSGGVSMGEKDHLKPCMRAAGADIHFGRVEMKPGKPTTFATAAGGDKAVFGLPGNPVSCLVCFHLFCHPALRKMQGHARAGWHRPVVRATLAGDRALPLDTERPEFHRAVVTFSAEQGRLVARSTGGQISSRLLSTQGANGLLRLPVGTAAAPAAVVGKEYDCVLFGSLLSS